MFLAELGSFEIVPVASTILSVATASIPVVIDNFIITVATLVTLRLDKVLPIILFFLIFLNRKYTKYYLNSLWWHITLPRLTANHY